MPMKKLTSVFFALISMSFLLFIDTLAFADESVSALPVGSIPCPEGQYEDLSASNRVCRELDRGSLGFNFDALLPPASNVRNITCNASALNTAINASAANSNVTTTIRIPSACTIFINQISNSNGSLSIPSNTILEGSGEPEYQGDQSATTIVGRLVIGEADDREYSPAGNSVAENVIVRGLRVNADNALQGFKIQDAKNILIERVSVDLAEKSNLNFRCSVEGLTIRYSHFLAAHDYHNIESRCNPPSEDYAIYSNVTEGTIGAGGGGAFGFNLHAGKSEVAGNRIANNLYAAKFFDGVDIYVHHNKFYDNARWDGLVGLSPSDIGIVPNKLFFYDNVGGGVRAWNAGTLYIFSNHSTFEVDDRGTNACNNFPAPNQCTRSQYASATTSVGEYLSGGGTVVPPLEPPPPSNDSIWVNAGSGVAQSYTLTLEGGNQDRFWLSEQSSCNTVRNDDKCWPALVVADQNANYSTTLVVTDSSGTTKRIKIRTNN